MDMLSTRRPQPVRSGARGGRQERRARLSSERRQRQLRRGDREKIFLFGMLTIWFEPTHDAPCGSALMLAARALTLRVRTSVTRQHTHGAPYHVEVEHRSCPLSGSIVARFSMAIMPERLSTTLSFSRCRTELEPIVGDPSTAHGTAACATARLSPIDTRVVA